MALVVYNYITCFVDKLLALALVTNYTTNYSIIKIIVIIVIIVIIIIIIIIIIIGFCCKPLKTYPLRD